MNLEMLENCAALSSRHVNAIRLCFNITNIKGSGDFPAFMVLLDAIDRLLPYAQRPANASRAPRRFRHAGGTSGRSGMKTPPRGRKRPSRRRAN